MQRPTVVLGHMGCSGPMRPLDLFPSRGVWSILVLVTGAPSLRSPPRPCTALAGSEEGYGAGIGRGWCTPGRRHRLCSLRSPAPGAARGSGQVSGALGEPGGDSPHFLPWLMWAAHSLVFPLATRLHALRAARADPARRPWCQHPHPGPAVGQAGRAAREWPHHCGAALAAPPAQAEPTSQGPAATRPLRSRSGGGSPSLWGVFGKSGAAESS